MRLPAAFFTHPVQTRRSYPHLPQAGFPQELSRLLLRRRVDIKTRAPFESRDPRQFRDYFDMPMKPRVRRLLKRSCVDQKIVRRFFEDSLQFPKRRSENPGKVFEVLRIGVFIMGFVLLRQYPGLERESRR